MTTVLLERRRNCYYDSFGRYRCYSSGWSNWGRWIIVGVIILFFFLFLLCVCLTTRRRRRRGARPFYGTGWMAQGVQPQQGYSQGPPPPQYGAPQQYNQGPNQESGYAPPMPDTPKPVYGGGQNQYEMYNPPPGPPPNRYG